MSGSGQTYPFGWVSDISRVGVGNATSLQGRAIDATQPSNDDLLQFNSANNTWENKSVGEVLTITGSDNQVIRYDATTGFIQNSNVIIGDTGNITGVNTLTANSDIFGGDIKSRASNNINIIDTAGTNTITLLHGATAVFRTSGTVINAFEPIVQNDLTASSGVGTGALIVAGGASVAGDLHVGDELFCSSLKVDTNKLIIDSTGNDTILSTQAQNLVVNTPSTGSRYFDVQSNAVSRFRVNPTTTTSVNPLSITSTTASTTVGTGSLINAGGFGCSGAINAGGIIRTTNTTISTSTATGSIVCGGGCGVAGTVNAGGLSFNGTDILSTYTNLSGTTNVWKDGFSYNYGGICSYTFIRLGTQRIFTFKIGTSVGAGGVQFAKIGTSSGSQNPFIASAADRPLSRTHGMVFLQNNAVDGSGYAYADTDGWIYIFPSSAWVSNVNNQVYTSTLIWNTAV
jgi:hypothetical protein